jgi:short-subunit dehydrogenase
MTTTVITGASAGIGRALALELAQRGHKLGLVGRRRVALEAIQSAALAAGSPQVIVAAIDLDDPSAARKHLGQLFAELGSVDVVIANAGINAFTRVGKDDGEQERRVLQTNVQGAMTTIDAAAAHFIAQGRGQIVGVTSLASLIPIPRQAAYCASKAALGMYLKAARIELQRYDIKVTDIMPGFVITDIMPDIGKYPFAVTAEKAAREMADAIAAAPATAIVPAFPWRFLRPLFPLLPKSIWKKL